MNVPLARDPRARSWWPLVLLPLLIVGGLTVLPDLGGRPSYAITPNALIVRTLAQTNTFARGEVRDLRRVTLALTAKTFGTDAPGYCVGRFQDARLGNLTLATNCTPDALTFVVGGARWAITPLDREAFLLAWNRGGTGTFAPTADRGERWRRALLSPAWLFALLPVALVAALTVRARRLRYDLTPDGLLVTAAFGALRVPYANITRAWRPNGRLGLRLMGAALPGYFSGTFAWKGDSRLKTVEALASAARVPGMVVAHDGRSLYLTPADPDRFLLELERRLPKTPRRAS